MLFLRGHSVRHSSRRRERAFRRWCHVRACRHSTPAQSDREGSGRHRKGDEGRVRRFTFRLGPLRIHSLSATIPSSPRTARQRKPKAAGKPAADAVHCESKSRSLSLPFRCLPKPRRGCNFITSSNTHYWPTAASSRSARRQAKAASSTKYPKKTGAYGQTPMRNSKEIRKRIEAMWPA